MQISIDYSKAIRRKYPIPIVIAIAKDETGKYNPITLGWWMSTSSKPPMMAISVGLTRYSLKVIRHAKEFVVSFPSNSMAKEALFYGTKSGRDLDKLAECEIDTQPAEKIDCVILSDAAANFECKLESEHLTGDHVIFVGRIVASHMNQDERVERLYTLDIGHKLGSVKKLL